MAQSRQGACKAKRDSYYLSCDNRRTPTTEQQISKTNAREMTAPEAVRVGRICTNERAAIVLGKKVYNAWHLPKLVRRVGLDVQTTR